jgi:hypothetical protein
MSVSSARTPPPSVADVVVVTVVFLLLFSLSQIVVIDIEVSEGQKEGGRPDRRQEKDGRPVALPFALAASEVMGLTVDDERVLIKTLRKKKKKGERKPKHRQGYLGVVARIERT